MRDHVLNILVERGVISEVYRRGKTTRGVSASQFAGKTKARVYRSLQSDPSKKMKPNLRKIQKKTKKTGMQLFKNRAASRKRSKYFRSFKGTAANKANRNIRRLLY